MWQKRLENIIEKFLENSSGCHDFYHLQRVKNYALKISEEVRCDKEVLVAAALLHDVGYKISKGDDNNHHLYSIKLANKWLPKVYFPKAKINDVIEAIRLHDNFVWDKNGEKTNHVESKIIQDADRIDALGAIGITRIIYYQGEHSYPIYNPKKVKKTKKVWLNHSVPDQIKRDPMKKWQHMNFEISKKISNKKNEFLKQFYHEIVAELLEHHKNWE